MKNFNQLSELGKKEILIAGDIFEKSLKFSLKPLNFEKSPKVSFFSS